MKEELGLDSSSEISFLSSHFYEIDSSSLVIVGVNDVERILCDSQLKLKDENSLVDFIVQHCDEYEAYYCLFRYVELQYLDDCHLNVYLNRVYPEHLDEGIWSCICHCLRGQFESKSLPVSLRGNRFAKSAPCGETYSFVEGSPFKGIMPHLREECGGNIHEKGVVTITESRHERNQPCQVTDYDWSDYWHTSNSPNSWICFDFEEKRVELTGYSLKSMPAISYCSHPIQWVIEGSNDGSNWREVDRRNTQDLNGKSIVKTYFCEDTKSERFRFIKLRQTGKDAQGYNYLALSGIEFFGTLFRDSNDS